MSKKELDYGTALMVVEGLMSKYTLDALLYLVDILREEVECWIEEGE
tara:strand:+ start:736 stop:876 length:141 start_codon:yes stop_codon:yes gene_type:complete